MRRSVDSLPFDVICLFFQWLALKDLASVSLTCHTWNDAAIARMYEHIVYKLSRSKSNRRMMSPFDVVTKHPSYGIHVKSIVVRCMPMYGPAELDLISSFAKTVELSSNLSSIVCDSAELHSHLIPRIQNKPRLVSLRLTGPVNLIEATNLSKVRNLQRISLHNPSRPLLYMLPQWLKELKDTLRSLIIINSIDVYGDLLSLVLPQLKELHTLHIQDCCGVTHSDVLRSLASIPSIQNLAFTIYTSPEGVNKKWPQLINLRHLKINVREPKASNVSATISNILRIATQSPLQSLTLDAGSWAILDAELLNLFVNHHKSSLKRLNLIDFKVTLPQISTICQECVELEQLAFHVQKTSAGTYKLGQVLAKSSTLHTLIDTSSFNGHGMENPTFYKPSDMRHVFGQAKSLKAIMVTGRTWTVTRGVEATGRSNGGIEITSHRRRDPYIYHFD